MAVEEKWDKYDEGQKRKKRFVGGHEGEAKEIQVDLEEKVRSDLLKQFDTLMLLADVSMEIDGNTSKKDFDTNKLVTEYQTELVEKGFDKEWSLVDDIRKESNEISWREEVILLRNYILGKSSSLDSEAVEWFTKMGWDLDKLEKLKEFVVKRIEEEGEGGDKKKGGEVESIAFKLKLAAQEADQRLDQLKEFFGDSSYDSVDKEVVEKNNDFNDPLFGLKTIIGNIKEHMVETKELVQHQIRLLVLDGYNVEVLGLKTKIEDNKIYFSNDLAEINIEKLLNLIAQIEKIMSPDAIFFKKNANKEIKVFFGEINLSKLDEFKNKNLFENSEVKEPVFYEDVFDDLYMAMRGEGEKKEEALKRLTENGVKLKVYGQKDEEHRRKYIEVLETLFNAPEIENKALELWVLKKHDMDRIPEVKEKYKDVVDKSKSKEGSVWNSDTFEKLYVGGYRANEEDGKTAIEELKKIGIDLRKALALKDDSELKKKLGRATWVAHKKKATKEFVSVEAAVAFLKEYFEGGEKKTENEVLDNVDEVKAGKKEIVWDDEVVEDLDVASDPKSAKEDSVKAWERLEKRGFFMKSDTREDGAVGQALDLLVGKGKGARFGGSKKVAVEYLKKYFGAVNKEKETTESGIRKETEKKETRRLSEEELMNKFRDLSVNKHIWAGYEDWLKTTADQETRRKAITRLQAAFYLYAHKEERAKHQPYWDDTATSLLRELGVADV